MCRGDRGAPVDGSSIFDDDGVRWLPDEAERPVARSGLVPAIGSGNAAGPPPPRSAGGDPGAVIIIGKPGDPPSCSAFASPPSSLPSSTLSRMTLPAPSEDRDDGDREPLRLASLATAALAPSDGGELPEDVVAATAAGGGGGDGDGDGRGDADCREGGDSGALWLDGSPMISSVLLLIDEPWSSESLPASLLKDVAAASSTPSTSTGL